VRDQGHQRDVNSRQLAVCDFHDTMRPNDARVELDIRGHGQGRARWLSAAPDGHLWLTTSMGNAFTAASAMGDWSASSIVYRDTTFDSGPDLGRIDFFDAHRAALTGFEAGRRDKRDHVRVTKDGGVHWDSVTVGDVGWVYDSEITPNGEMWIGGSRGALFHSSDFGSHWELRSQPFNSTWRLNRIAMLDASHGYVAALGNAIKETSDGGRTWRDVPTPIDQHLVRFDTADGHYDDGRITVLVPLGERLLATQEGRTFVTPRDRIAWTPLSGPRLLVVARDAESDRLLAVTESLEVVAIDTSLRSTRITERRLAAPPVSLYPRGGTLYVLDDEGRIYAIAPGSFACGFPLAGARRAPLLWSVRAPGRTWWGASEHALYSSADRGATWSPASAAPFAIAGIAPRDDRSLMAWDRHGHNAIFEQATNAWRTIPDLDGADVVRVLQLPDEWIAYGGRQYEETNRIEVSMTYFGGQFSGSRPDGFVYASRDHGTTWTLIHTWKKHGVAGMYVFPGGDMVLISYLGAVRRLTRSGSEYSARDVLQATEKNMRQVPYVQWVSAIYFASDSIGYVGGEIHEAGSRRFRTSDGGATWVALPSDSFAFHEVIPGGGGTIAWDRRTVVELHGASTREIATVWNFSPKDTAYIRDVSVAAGDSLLVEWALESPNWRVTRPSHWTMLAPSQVP
jgi:photosystem II stability/assembly factor-like uncharacterized protein